MNEKMIGSNYKLGLNEVFKAFVGLYIILLPISTGLSGIIGSISLSNYVALAIIIIGATQARSIQFKVIPTLLYFLYTVVSIIWSKNIDANWYVMTNLVNCILFVTLNTYKWKSEEINQLYKCLIISQIIVFISVLINLHSFGDYRLTITIVSTIGISDFACGLCLIISLLMDLASTSNKTWIRIFCYFSIFIDLSIILMSGSRGALAMFAAMIITWVLLGNYSKRIKAITIIIICIALFIFQHFFIGLLPTYITNRLTIEAVMESHGSGRYDIWHLAWETFKNSNFVRIIFGYGFNSFLETVSYGSHGGYQNLLAHNVVIQTMIEGGVIGLVLLFWMIITQFKEAWHRHDNMMMIALVGLNIAALSNDMQVTRIWGFILSFNYMKCLRGEMIEN